jgi:glycine/D-amino acid oxidase-like deaminating enzyme/nitrite reductase/ring-hydroxylating ferredoxin subunit
MPEVKIIRPQQRSTAMHSIMETPSVLDAPPLEGAPRVSSLWSDTAPETHFPKLEGNRHVDVLVVGGGIMGLTAAYLLRKEGLSVAVIERERIGCGQTGQTTAHVTRVTDTRLSDLVKTFGRDHAQAVWDAGAHAMGQINNLALETDAECELRLVPAYLVAAADGDLASEEGRLREEARLAAELGFGAEFVEIAPLLGRPAMLVPNQFKFHPRKYVWALAQAASRLGVEIFEETAVTEFYDRPRSASAGGHTITYDRVVLATHVPLKANTNVLSATLLQSKLAAYSTYAVQALMPTGRFPEMLWWDTADPYHYVRVDRHVRGDVLIVGGEDHKTGQKTNTEECYQRLERVVAALVPEAVIERRWSGQVLESVDGLPYIGEVNDGQFVAAGFGGNGMTFGTLAGMMARDAIIGASNPWSDLFSPDRKKLAATWNYLSENSDYPYYMAKGRLEATETGGIESLAAGEGKILRVNGHRVAAYRDDEGKVHQLSPVCPHMGCVVRWNEAQHTWDCPCHGSRFTCTGNVMAGPAERDLAQAKSS